MDPLLTAPASFQFLIVNAWDDEKGGAHIDLCRYELSLSSCAQGT